MSSGIPLPVDAFARRAAEGCSDLPCGVAIDNRIHVGQSCIRVYVNMFVFTNILTGWPRFLLTNIGKNIDAASDVIAVRIGSEWRAPDTVEEIRDPYRGLVREGPEIHGPRNDRGAPSRFG